MLEEKILKMVETIILNNGEIVEQIEKKELVEKSNIFEKYEIRIPTLLEILVKLKSNGIELDNNDVLTVDSLVKELCVKIKK